MAVGLGGWLPSIVHTYDIFKGIVLYGYGGQRPAARNAIPSQNESFYVPDETGTMLFYFDTWGRHSQTVDALTGVRIYKFSYNPATRKLVTITDRFNKETTIDHASNQITITSPRGEITTLNLNSEQMLSSVVNRNSETFNMTYSSEKLLLTFQKPGGLR